MQQFIWSDCSDRMKHAFRIDENGRRDRVSVCGEMYHPEVVHVKNPRQLGLSLACPVCENFELESNRKGAQSVKE